MSLALGMVACGDDDVVDTRPPGDMGIPDTSMPPPDVGQPDGSEMTGDGNDSFSEADAIELAVTIEGAAISPAGDLDYYSFTGTAGQWIVITTDANPEDDLEMLDTVVTLYDASMNVVAENDDSIPRTNTDSQLVTRLPADGTYFVLVQEWTTWASETPEGNPSFMYDLSIGQVDPAAPSVTIDAEGGDDAASAQPLRLESLTNGDVGLLIGDLRDASDVDIYSFAITEARPWISFTVLAKGTDATGSTADPSMLWVTNMDGTEVIARVAPNQNMRLSPGLPPGNYLLWVEHGGATGANDFYVVRTIRSGTDNDVEMSEDLNGVAATAEAISQRPADDDNIRRGFILAQLPEGDTDYYSVQVLAGEVLTVACRSRTAGSGILDLTVAIIDITGATEIVSDTETDTDNVFHDGIDVGEPGTYLVRLTRGAQDPEVTGTWVRCGFVTGPPTPSP